MQNRTGRAFPPNTHRLTLGNLLRCVILASLCAALLAFLTG